MYEIIEMVVAALIGGGLWGLVTWRVRKKKLERENAVKDYREFEDIIDSYIDRMSKLSDEIVKLQEENMSLRQQLIVQLEITKQNDNRDEQPD